MNGALPKLLINQEQNTRLAFFVRGLEQGLFPVGESIAYAFARKANLAWLLVFAFALGFGTTIAEPALTAVSGEAAEIAAEDRVIARDEESMPSWPMHNSGSGGSGEA